MLDITKIPYTVLSDIRERGHSDERIAQMTPEEAFREYCEWNGLINWGGSLWRTANSLKRQEAPNVDALLDQVAVLTNEHLQVIGSRPMPPQMRLHLIKRLSSVIGALADHKD